MTARSRTTVLIVIAFTLLSLGGGLVVKTSSRDVEPEISMGPELVVNGTFEEGISTGWRTNHAYNTLALADHGHSGSGAAVLTTAPGTDAVLNDKVSTVASAVAGVEYEVSAWVRTDKPELDGILRIRDVLDDHVNTIAQDYRLVGTDWQRVHLTFVAGRSGSEFDLNIVAHDMTVGQHLFVDDISLRTLGPALAGQSKAWILSNGARLSPRGIPSRGALFGAAVGANSDPTSFERSIGQRLGVRRTFWVSNKVDVAVSVARTDLASGRLPWMSFKLPYSWSQMAEGRGDAWASDLATKLASLPGPVWVAFHHEPEGDGPIAEWTLTQERLGPIVRDLAPNVGFTVILTGWNQFYGPREFSLKEIWPNTTVDIAGFDLYNWYGTTTGGSRRMKRDRMRSEYFERISVWARSQGVAWAVAETAFTDRASSKYPNWLRDTYEDLVDTGGVAFCYFNTTLNSGGASWVIKSPAKTKQFARAIDGAPRFPRL